MDDELLISLPDELLEDVIQLPKTLTASLAAESCKLCQYTCQDYCEGYCMDACEGISCQKCESCENCQTCERVCEYSCQNCQGASCQMCQCSREGGEIVHTPITITGGSISPTTITSGSSVTFSWTATGDYETIGSWQLRRTTTSSFTDPVEIGSKSQGGSKSFTMDAWGPTGTYYIWVFYYGETGSTEYTSNIYKIGTLTVNPSPVTYTLSVYSYLNNSVYDSGSVTNIVSGTSKTCFQWVTDAGVDLPPSPAVFKKYTWGANEFTDTTIQLSVSSNISLKVYYTASTSNVEVYIFHNGDWCLAEPNIKTNGDWALTAADIFDGDWQNT